MKAILSAKILRSVLALVIISVCTGCPRHEPGAVMKNEVKIGLSAAPKTLDPRLATDVSSARVQQLLYNSLVRKNRHSELVPDLAESWEMTDDQTYLFRLRSDVQFHDGSKLTAHDVKATFDAILSDTLASPRKGAYDKLESVTVKDDLTVIFRTKEPFAPFLINMVQGILPRKEAEKTGQNQAIHPIGTGPFKVADRSGDDLIVLSAHDNYFRQRPKLDSVIFKVIPDDTIRVMQLEKGDLDFLQNNVPVDALPRLKENPDLKVVSEAGTAFYYLGLNFRLDNPARDLKVRRALAYAMNRDEIITFILGGYASPATGVLPEGHWAFNADIPQMPFDPDKARQLLDEAGYPEVEGARFTIGFKCSQNKRSQRLAQVIQAQWGAVGIKVEIRSLEWGTFYDDILKGNFETYVLSWVGVTDPDIYYSLFHSSSFPPDGRNRGRYVSPRMDQLLTDARAMLDQATRAGLYRQVQSQSADDLPYINLWHNHNIAVMSHRVSGYQMYPAGDFDSFADVFLTAKEQ